MKGGKEPLDARRANIIKRRAIPKLGSKPAVMMVGHNPWRQIAVAGALCNVCIARVSQLRERSVPSVPAIEKLDPSAVGVASEAELTADVAHREHALLIGVGIVTGAATHAFAVQADAVIELGRRNEPKVGAGLLGERLAYADRVLRTKVELRAQNLVRAGIGCRRSIVAREACKRFGIELVAGLAGSGRACSGGREVGGDPPRCMRVGGRP